MMEYEHKIGWLDPTGTMIECGHSDHIATARTLVDLYHYQNPDHLPEDDVLLKHGWVHVTMSLLGNREWRHFLKLRCSPAAHPQMREVALILLDKVHWLIPVCFDDIWSEYHADV